ncbi:MAG: DUF2894 domain-containing protein [Hahellaceae bacterium]|nr:DUF2894 domain-containing protein [Hahellaceae bacterium]MCP5170150.1 DUF2894 domain-containing protein [Hahellaceae bacterium]
MSFEIRQAWPESLLSGGSQWEELSGQGARNFDPLRYHFIEVMVARTAQSQGVVAEMLAEKVRQALSEFSQAFSRARLEAEAELTQLIQQDVSSAEEANRLFDTGDFRGLKRLTLRGATSTSAGRLAGLTKQLKQSAASYQETTAEPSFDALLRQQEKDIMQSFAATGAGDPASMPGQNTDEAAGELNAVQLFRESWIKRNFDKLVAQAVKDGPESPGPLNPDMLMIRSLTTLRDCSPSYLYRYISYLDTLLWLEQAGAGGEAGKVAKTTAKAPARSKTSAGAKAPAGPKAPRRQSRAD